MGVRITLFPHFKNGHAGEKDHGAMIKSHLDFFLPTQGRCCGNGFAIHYAG